MSLDNIIAGDYGQQVQLTMIDTNTDAAADVSAYTTAQQFFLKTPSGVIGSAKTASFDSDGSDGLIEYSLVDGDIPTNSLGTWSIRARVTSGSAILTSEWVEFNVKS